MGEDRRRHSRRALTLSARAASGAEQPLNGGQVVDLSLGGVLLRFDDQHQPVVHEDKVLVTLHDRRGCLHLLGTVRRFVRGADDAFYLAVEFTNISADDRHHLAELVRSGRDDGQAGDVPTRWHPTRAAAHG